MRILDKYILKQYIISYLLIFASFSILFIVIEVFDRLPRLLRHTNDIWLITQYFLYRLPYLFVLTSPVIVLLSGLVLMNGLSKFSETIATRAAGISIFRTVLPLFFVGLFISICVLLFGEYVLPRAENKRELIYNVNMRQREVEDIKMRSNIYYSDENFIYYLSFFDGYQNKIRAIDITELDDNHKIIRKIQANEADWNGESWIFRSTHDRYFENAQLTKYVYHHTTVLPEVTVTPLDFIKSAKKPMEMNYFELRDYIHRLKKIGEKYHKEETDLLTKIAFPFANFIILLFCVPLASASVRTKGRGVIFFLGILICLIFLMTVRTWQSLGYNEVISPVTAAWLPHIIFFIVGVVIVIRSEI